LRPRDGALDEQQVALGVGLDDGEVEGRGLAAAGPAGHAGAAEDPGGGGAGADGAGRPVHPVGAVAGAEAAEAVALHDAAEALALADGGDVHALAGGEDVDLDLLADLVLADVVEPQLDQADARLDAGPGVVAGEGLVELGGLLVPEGDLQRVVPVALVRLDLDHAARADAQDGDRDDAVLVVPHLRHADLLADDRSCGHGGCVSLCLVRPLPRRRSPGRAGARDVAESSGSRERSARDGPGGAPARLCRVVPAGAGLRGRRLDKISDSAGAARGRPAHGPSTISAALA